MQHILHTIIIAPHFNVTMTLFQNFLITNVPLYIVYYLHEA